MTDMGHGAWPAPILKLAYEKYGSLQQMVQMALRELREEGEELFGDDKAEEFADDQKAWLEYVDRVAATMVQISQAGFPDIQHTYDFSTKWFRTASEAREQA